MPNIDTIPCEVARIIIDNVEGTMEDSITLKYDLPWKRALRALSQTNKAARRIYLAMLFENVIAEKDYEFVRLIKILLDPELASCVKHAILLPRKKFGSCSITLDNTDLARIRTMDIWSEAWQNSLVLHSPHALCGLILALVPNLVTLRITTVKMNYDWWPKPWSRSAVFTMPLPRPGIFRNRLYPEKTEEMNWNPPQAPDDESTTSLSQTLISAADLFGPVANSHPEKIPNLANLYHLTTTGLVPLFFLNLPKLESIAMEIESHALPTAIDRREFPQINAANNETITDITISIFADVTKEPHRQSSFNYLKDFSERMLRAKRLTIKVDESWRYKLDLGLLSAMIGGSAASLSVDVFTGPGQNDGFYLSGLCQLPDLHMKEIVNLPEYMLINYNNPQKALTREMESSSVFRMRSLRIYNATSNVGKILSIILRDRKSRFPDLGRLEVRYARSSRLSAPRENEEPGETSNEGENENILRGNQRLLQTLRRSLQQWGIEVIFGYDLWRYQRSVHESDLFNV